jgi:hypothetical protein
MRASNNNPEEPKVQRQGKIWAGREHHPNSHGALSNAMDSRGRPKVTQGKLAWSAKLSAEALNAFARRRERRQNGGSDKRLPFDCFHAKLQHGRVACAKDRSFSCRDGTASGLLVLKGACLAPCQACHDWDDGDALELGNFREPGTYPQAGWQARYHGGQYRCHKSGCLRHLFVLFPFFS